MAKQAVGRGGGGGGGRGISPSYTRVRGVIHGQDALFNEGLSVWPHLGST